MGRGQLNEDKGYLPRGIGTQGCLLGEHSVRLMDGQ